MLLGAAGLICANFATCSWEPLVMLNPQFVAGEHGLFGDHKSEDIRTFFSSSSLCDNPIPFLTLYVYTYILGRLYSLLMSELDINDQKANRQNNPEGGNNAQCHVYSHVDSIGHDAGYGLIFGRVWSRPINVRTAF